MCRLHTENREHYLLECEKLSVNEFDSKKVLNEDGVG